MALREIIKKGDPVLEKHCHPVTRFDQKLWDLLDDMRETLAQANGLGLAAPRWASCAERSWWSTTRRRCWS